MNTIRQSVSFVEFSKTAVGLGIVIAIIMTAANVYLGLYAGMTVSASIPAAVIAMGVFRGILKQKGLHQSNIVQTMASAGESLAAGIIFTLPALVIIGAWQGFKFWPTTLIAIAGGLLGIIFMIPLRRALIIEDKELTYPEGVACAAVLEAGSDGDGKGALTIFKGLFLGAIFKFLASGLHLFQGTVEKAFSSSGKTWYLGSDISPALMAVGYIVKLEVAVLVFIGGAIGWFIGIPLMGIEASLASLSPLDAAWTLWSTQIRYLGVGAMLVGGLWSIVSVRKGIASGVKELKKGYKQKSQSVERVDQDMSLIGILAIFASSLFIMFFLYNNIIGKFGLSVLTTMIMVLAAFIFVAVSSYIVGLVGSSNNPVSGMTICALLGTAAFFLILGFKGNSAILATLGVAAVVCCAACTAADCSQDLKTGVLIQATPKYQQYAQIIGVCIPAFVIGPVLTLLHQAYGIGTGLKAPQATLFASITKAIFGEGELPYQMVFIGAGLGVAIILIDSILKKKNASFRLYLMPIAVGIYLPISLAVPILLGGVIRHFVDKKRNEKTDEGSDNGILLGSGLIAGEAIMGIFLAVLLYFNIKIGLDSVGQGLSETLSIVAILGIAGILYSVARKKA